MRVVAVTVAGLVATGVVFLALHVGTGLAVVPSLGISWVVGIICVVA